MMLQDRENVAKHLLEIFGCLFYNACVWDNVYDMLFAAFNGFFKGYFKTAKGLATACWHIKDGYVAVFCTMVYSLLLYTASCLL